MAVHTQALVGVCLVATVHLAMQCITPMYPPTPLSTQLSIVYCSFLITLQYGNSYPESIPSHLITIFIFIFSKMVSSQAIEALMTALSTGHFIQRGTEQYDQLNSSYLSGLESDLQPAYIFQPLTKEEVVTFVKVFKQFIDKDKFAIRGAGCQPDPGCANIQDGITVDLGLLTGVDIKEGLVRIGSGEHWGTVYDKLDAQGLGVCGSRSAKGGIGGLALEGLC